MFKKQDSIFITYTHPDDQKRRSNRRAVSSFVSKSYRPTSRKIVFEKTQYRPFLASAQRPVAAPESTTSAAPKAKRAIPKTRNASTASASPRPPASPAASHQSELNFAPTPSLEPSVFLSSQSTGSSPSVLPFTPSPEPEFSYQAPSRHRTSSHYPDPRSAQPKPQLLLPDNSDQQTELSYLHPRQHLEIQRQSRSYTNAYGAHGLPDFAPSSSQTPYASQAVSDSSNFAFALPETQDSFSDVFPWWYDYNIPYENASHAWNQPQR
jgi:hypothetical protein